MASAAPLPVFLWPSGQLPPTASTLFSSATTFSVPSTSTNHPSQNINSNLSCPSLTPSREPHIMCQPSPRTLVTLVSGPYIVRAHNPSTDTIVFHVAIQGEYEWLGSKPGSVAHEIWL